VYSSQVGAWGDLVSVHLDVDVEYYWDQANPSSWVLVGDGIYFLLALGAGDKILKYNLGMHCLSTMDLPDLESNKGVVLMPTEEGLLGLACTGASTLCLCPVVEDGEWRRSCRLGTMQGDRATEGAAGCGAYYLGESYWFC
jgi:hypothetical protein